MKHAPAHLNATAAVQIASWNKHKEIIPTFASASASVSLLTMDGRAASMLQTSSRLRVLRVHIGCVLEEKPVGTSLRTGTTSQP